MKLHCLHITLTLLHLILSLTIISRSLGEPNIVKSLPGYPGNLPFTLETGYIGVGEEEQVKLFYYFIESERDVENDPLMLWLTGGPGCSGLSSIVFEIGPFVFNLTTTNSKSDTIKLQQNPYSWTKVASIIFLDSPVGTGFSYGTSAKARYSSDTLQSTHILEFLRKWLIEHPKFAKSSLYISGDSYAGIIVPIVVQGILRENEIGVKPKLNLKGYTIGNPITTPGADKNADYKYAHRISLLSDELYKLAVISCNGDFDNVDADNTKCLKVIEAIEQDIKSINHGQVLQKLCAETSPKSLEKLPSLNRRKANSLLLKDESCGGQDYSLASLWVDDKKVREALHIQEGSIGDHWIRCNKNLPYALNVPSSVGYHMNISRESIQALIYNGDQDMLATYVGTLEWIEELKIPISDDWRPWFVDGQVAGYVTEFSHLLYRLVYTTIKVYVLGNPLTTPYADKQTADKQTIYEYVNRIALISDELYKMFRYVGVSEEEQVKLFYYFIESERDVETDPLILWLTGGPGCSALSTILFEIGPLAFNLTASNSESPTPTLRQNPYSWTKVANIIFLDSPAGTGFSYATTYDAYFSTDTLQSTHILEFLRKWLIEHPKFSQSSLYISGDSYSGMIVPIVAQKILQGNEIGVTPKLNLKGYILGNPITTIGTSGNNVKFKYAQQISLLSDELYKSALISCNGDFRNVDAKNARCLKIMQVMNQDIKLINPGFVLGHNCVNISPKRHNKFSRLKYQEANPLLVKGEACWSQDYALAYTWADDEKVREALHVKKGSTGHWVRCNKTLAYTYDVESSIAYHVNMSTESLQILIYNGDQDMMVPYMGTLKWIKELNVPVTDEWRPWFVNGQVAGYSTEFSVLPYRLVHTTIKGGSHTPSDIKPRECLAMIDRWFSLSPL